MVIMQLSKSKAIYNTMVKSPDSGARNPELKSHLYHLITMSPAYLSLVIMDTKPYGAERASCKLHRKSEAMNHGAGLLLGTVCLNRLQIDRKAA